MDKKYLECMHADEEYYEPTVELSVTNKQVENYYYGSFTYPKNIEEFKNWFISVLEEYTENFEETLGKEITISMLRDFKEFPSTLEDVMANVELLEGIKENSYVYNQSEKLELVLYGTEQVYGGFKQELIIDKQLEFILMDEETFQGEIFKILKKNNLVKLMGTNKPQLVKDKLKAEIDSLESAIKSKKERVTTLKKEIKKDEESLKLFKEQMNELEGTKDE